MKTKSIKVLMAGRSVTGTWLKDQLAIVCESDDVPSRLGSVMIGNTEVFVSGIIDMYDELTQVMLSERDLANVKNLESKLF